LRIKSIPKAYPFFPFHLFALIPAPELPRIILTSTGLLALMGYVMYSRRRKEQ
jgi:hypothetical protein